MKGGMKDRLGVSGPILFMGLLKGAEEVINGEEMRHLSGAK